MDSDLYISEGEIEQFDRIYINLDKSLEYMIFALESTPSHSSMKFVGKVTGQNTLISDVLGIGVYQQFHHPEVPVACLFYSLPLSKKKELQPEDEYRMHLGNIELTQDNSPAVQMMCVHVFKLIKSSWRSWKAWIPR